MDNIITIQLFGEVYKFKAEAEVADASRVADFLMSELDQVEKNLGAQAKSVTKTAKLLLATMNIANTYFEQKRQYEDMLSELQQRSDRLLERLDAADSSGAATG